MLQQVDVYNDVIRDAKNLPPAILSHITVPEAVYAPEAYLKAPIRCLIAGAEAFGGGQALTEAQIDATAHDRMQWKESFFKDRVIAKKFSTPFWRQFDWIAEGLELSGREAIAYSNVCRVQRLHPVEDRFSLNVGPALFEENYGTTRMRIGAWQSPLVRYEWETLKPDIVIVTAITGHQWLKKTFPDLNRRDASIDNYRIEVWENLPAPTIGIRHPGRGRYQASAEVRPKIIALIESLIADRSN